MLINHAHAANDVKPVVHSQMTDKAKQSASYALAANTRAVLTNYKATNENNNAPTATKLATLMSISNDSTYSIVVPYLVTTINDVKFEVKLFHDGCDELYPNPITDKFETVGCIGKADYL